MHSKNLTAFDEMKVMTEFLQTVKECKEKVFSDLKSKDVGTEKQCLDVKFICEKCNESFLNFSLLGLHCATKHSLNLTVETENKTTVGSIRPRDHVDPGERCFGDPIKSVGIVLEGAKTQKWDFCQNRFVSKSSITTHIKKPPEENYHRWNDRDKPNSQERGICENSFSEKESPDLLQNTIHKEETITSTRSVREESFSVSCKSRKPVKIPTVEIFYRCNICDKRFEDISLFRHHSTTHNGENLQNCNSSDELFGHCGNLKKHVRVVQNGEKPYKCNVCDRLFSFKGILDQHVKSHTGKNLYTCCVCNKSYSYYNSYKYHCKTHTGENSYKCSVCYKSYSYYKSYKFHCENHTEENAYRCSVCNKSYSYYKSYKDHCKTHIGETPYKCYVCGRLFSRKGYLERHVKYHTGEKPYGNVGNYSHSYSCHKRSKYHSRNHTVEKSYKCDVCEKYFASKSIRKQHFRTHTGERPYKCVVCDHSFSQKVHLKKHMRTHTSEKSYTCDVW